MAETLQGKRVAILAADGVERVELEKPREALEQAGARMQQARSPSAGWSPTLLSPTMTPCFSRAAR